MIMSHYLYWVAIALMMIGFYAVIVSPNLVKKLIGLTIFQTSVLLLYVGAGKVAGGVAPIYTEGAELYSNPLPQVLMLTAIVVGVAIISVGLALAVRIRTAYNTVEEDEIIAMNAEDEKKDAELARKEADA